MIKMQLEYAEKILRDRERDHRFHSATDDMMVIRSQDYHSIEYSYYGTEMVAGRFRVDEKGYVVFSYVLPIIDENTRWRFYG